MADATFEDGAEQPLRMLAETAEDVQVISTFIQDAVGQNSEISWRPKKHQFSMLLNRFRWENVRHSEATGQPQERVQSVLNVDSCVKVTSQGIDPNDKDVVFELLSVSFAPSDEGAGTVLLTLAGDGTIALDVECIDLKLTDVSRPYIARTQSIPHHPED